MKKEFNEDHTPLGYLITFRTYGTWLHGDDRGSIDRHNNRYGAPLVTPNQRWLAYNKAQLKHRPVQLTRKQRALIKESIERTCDFWVGACIKQTCERITCTPSSGRRVVRVEF